MVQILRTLGLQLRLVGPLTVANVFYNPSFEHSLSGSPTSWTPLPRATLTSTGSTFKFDSQSCKVDIASSPDPSALVSGLHQPLQIPVMGDQTYTASAWIKIGATLTNSLNVSVTTYDSFNTLISTLTTPLSAGSVTDWTQVSAQFVMPPTAQTADISFNISSTGANSFWIDGAKWYMGTDPSYLDGNSAGYVWVDNTEPDCATLQSTAPDALKFFNNGTSTPTPIPVIS